jgi:hypothetical protein
VESHPTFSQRARKDGPPEILAEIYAVLLGLFVEAVEFNAPPAGEKPRRGGPPRSAGATKGDGKTADLEIHFAKSAEWGGGDDPRTNKQDESPVS